MDRIRLAELCASASLFTDLGTGQPLEHGLRTCLVAMRLADVLDVGSGEAQQVYYVSLLRFLGCTADSQSVAEMAGGNDNRFLGAMAPAFLGSPREELGLLFRLVGEGEPLPRKLRLLARALADPASKERLLQAHCEVAARLALDLGLPDGVATALSMTYARWDGGGVPRDVGGDAIPRSMQVAIVARDLELWCRETDSETARDVLRRRRGRAYAPAVVDAALGYGLEELRRCETGVWDTVLALEPSPRLELLPPDLPGALGALGDFADLKLPEFAGHCRRVARLATSAAGAIGLAKEETGTLTGAALAHDLGRVAVPVGVWKNRASPDPGEWEQIRLHPMWTQRILGRCTGLEQVAVVAGRHHERLDGSGYPSGIGGDLGRAAGVLACAELYEELSKGVGAEPTGSRPPVSEKMLDLAFNGALERRCVDAVLEAAGIPVPLVAGARPAGLTEREIDVLRLLSTGHTNRQIATTLSISASTVGTHVEHIYAKAGVRTRAAAALFAARNDLTG